MSWLSALIWVNVRHFFPWEPLNILFRNLMGRLFSMKGSNCTIFHIFLGTFGCAGQKFRDYFCILTFSPQWLVRLGWNLARSFPWRICAFSSHFPSHQWISIFISELWLSTTVALEVWHNTLWLNLPKTVTQSSMSHMHHRWLKLKDILTANVNLHHHHHHHHHTCCQFCILLPLISLPKPQIIPIDEL